VENNVINKTFNNYNHKVEAATILTINNNNKKKTEKQRFSFEKMETLKLKSITIYKSHHFEVTLFYKTSLHKKGKIE
jgi:hypothetical protein